MHPATENLSITKSTTTKKLDPRNTKKKIGPTKYSREKFWVQKVSARKNFGPKKYPRENISGQQIPTRKVSDLRNTHERKFCTHKILQKKNWAHEIPTNA